MVERRHRLCPVSECELRCDDCGVCAHQFACECQDWVSQKLPCKHVHLVCLLAGDEVQTVVERAAPSESDAAPPSDQDPVPDAGSPHPEPLVMPTIARPGCPSDKENVLGRLKKLTHRVERKDDMPPETWAALLAQLCKLEQTVDLHDAEVTRTLPPTADCRPSTSRIEPQPTFRSKRRRREAPREVVQRSEGGAARQAMRALASGEAGREKRPAVHEDHYYT